MRYGEQGDMSLRSNMKPSDSAPSINRVKAPIRVPLAVSIAEAMMGSIQKGEWSDVLPGERSLCIRYQVSRPSLRQALAKLEREGWIQTLPSKVRRIRRRPPVQDGEIGTDRRRIVFLTDFRMDQLDPFAVMGIATLRRIVSDGGYYLEFVSSVDFAHERVSANFERVVKSHPSAGWILHHAPQVFQAWFADRKIPAVIMGTPYPGIPLDSVDLDFRATSRHAAGMLLSRGHRADRLRLLISGEHLAGIAAAQAGFLDALGPAVGNNHRIVAFKDRDDLGRQIKRLFDLDLPPTGLIVQRPVHALYTLGFLMARLHRTLPRDVSLISLDDDPSLRYALPEIARYTKNAERFISQLWKALLRTIQGQPAPATRAILLMPDFIPGETVGPPPAGA